MYVFVQVAELTGEAKQVALGQVEDDITLQTLLERCLQRIDKYLSENNRDASRHFWFNNRLVPFERSYLRDLASSVNVTLELRTDSYKVELPGAKAEEYAVNPELTAADAIDFLLGTKGASCCYQLLPQEGEPLKETETLLQQKTLPYHGRLDQQEKVLQIRRKPQTWTWSALVIGIAIVIGLIVGYLFAHLGG